MYLSNFQPQCDMGKSLMRTILNEMLLSGPSIIYGAGIEGIRTLIELKQNGVVPLCFIDADADKHGSIIGGVTIYPLEKLHEYDKETVIIVTPWFSILQITKTLEALGFHNILYRLVDPKIYDSGLSRIPEHDRVALVENNKDKIDAVRSKLSDNKSREIFDAAIWARINADSTQFERYTETTERQYYPYSIPGFQLSECEVFVDCGAYDGGGICEFSFVTGKKYKYIYAFEPNPINFALTKAAIEHSKIDNISVYNLGLSDYSQMVMMTDSTHSSRISEEGVVPVCLDSLDNILYEMENRPTFIKLDVEGTEPDALIGAKRIIDRDHPKLAICIYHSPFTQLWEIPYYIMRNHPDYKLFIRQYSLYVDTVLYAL